MVPSEQAENLQIRPQNQEFVKSWTGQESLRAWQNESNLNYQGFVLPGSFSFCNLCH